MRKISGVLLALAASLALGATTVAAKDDVVGGGGGGEKMQNEGKGGGGVKKCVTRARRLGTIVARSLASCMRRSLGLGRSAFPSLPLAPRLLKSRLPVSQTFNGGSSIGGCRLCEHMKPLARRDAGRCLASLSLSKHLRGVRISVVSRTSPNARGSQRARSPSC